MGFIGALPREVLRVFAAWASAVTPPVINVCAGNFTIPSVLRSAGYAGPIVCCDVSLYTSALGAYLTDAPLEIHVRPDAPAHLADLVSLESPLEAIASIALLYDLREVWQIKNPFQARQVGHYRRIWPQLMEKTRAKLAAYKEHLAGIRYEARDGFEVLQEADPAGTVITAPPTYKGGYERLEKLLAAVFEWRQPAYRVMVDKDLEIYRLIARFADYAVVLYKDMPEVYEILGPPTAVLSGQSTLRIITRADRPRIVLRRGVKTEAVGPFLPADYPITGRERLGLARISLAQSLRMNELFLSSRIDSFAGGIAESLAFTLDGRIFGKADFCKSTHQWKLAAAQSPPPMIYLMSDLVVPSRAERLSKLVLLCLLSREVKQLLDLRLCEDFAYVVTTAFSARPSSMKYRGIFKLHKRLKDPGGFRLNYFAAFGSHPLQKALQIWTGKHAKKEAPCSSTASVSS